MKKLVLALCVAFATSVSFAQKKNNMQMSSDEFSKDFEKKYDEFAEKRLAKIEKDLQLNPKQVAAIKEIQERNKQERLQNAKEKHEQQKAKMEKMKAKKEQHKAEMKKILTPEQYEKWERQIEEKNKLRKEKIKEKRERMPEIKALKPM